jgi:hypothetical protein
MKARVKSTLLFAGALLLGAAAARADTPMPANAPGPPLTVTTPPPPDIAGTTSKAPNAPPATASARAAAEAARTPLPTAPSAAATLGLKTGVLLDKDTPDAPNPAGNASAAAATGALQGERTTEPKVEHLVTEDGSVRIEEERVRSQTTRIVVKSKIPGMGSYEIAPADLTRDPSSDTKGGKRIWFSIGF